MKLITIPDTMDHNEGEGMLSHIVVVTAGIIMACLASVWKVLRETPPERAIPNRVMATAVLGGVLSGVMVMGSLLHLYDWEHPWAILVVSIPSGFGAPLIMAAAVNALATLIKGAADALARRDK